MGNRSIAVFRRPFSVVVKVGLLSCFLARCSIMSCFQSTEKRNESNCQLDSDCWLIVVFGPNWNWSINQRVWLMEHYEERVRTQQSNNLKWCVATGNDALRFASWLSRGWIRCMVLLDSFALLLSVGFVWRRRHRNSTISASNYAARSSSPPLRVKTLRENKNTLN